MKQSRRQRRVYLLSAMFAIAPIAFALIRAFRSHYDLRILWMACAAFVGAAVVMAFAGARRRTVRGLFLLASVALIVAMLGAVWVAMRLGATAAAGIWPVAFVLSFCWVMSFVLGAIGRPREVERSQRPAA